MKKIKIFLPLLLVSILFCTSPIINKAHAFSGTVYSINGAVYGDTDFHVNSLINLTSEDIANAVPAPYNTDYTCGPITTWQPMYLFYQDGNIIDQEGGNLGSFPITQTQGYYTNDFSQDGNVTHHPVLKEAVIFTDGNNCEWSDQNSVLDSSGLIVSNSSPLISVTDLPAAFNYPIQANAQAAINSVPNINIYTGSKYTYLGTFTEPNLTSLTATVDYGDGSSQQPLVLNSTSFYLNHVYSSAGTYTITISITDGQNNTITKNATVTVSNSDWTLDSTHQFLYNDSKTAYTLSYNLNANNTRSNQVDLSWCGSDTNISDANRLHIFPPYTQGSTARVVITNTSGVTVYSTSLFPMPSGVINISVDCISGVVKINNTTLVSTLTTSGGTYNTIHLITDNSNNENFSIVGDPTYTGITTVCSPFFVNCPPLPPNPPSIGTFTVSPNPVQINNATNATASFTDPAGGSTATASWNWGDGSTSSGTVTESNGSGSVTNNHTYTSLGSYTAIVTVTSSSSLTGTSQKVIAVIPTGGLAKANLSHTNYNGANFSNQDLSKVNGSNAQFANVNFTSATLTKANLSNSNFTGSNFTNADLTKSNISNSNLTIANFTGANLTKANLSNATLTGVTWSNTTCPDGTNSNNDGNTCVGHL